MTCTDAQIRKLMKLINTHTQEIAAAKAGIDPKTARKYLQAGRMPSQLQAERDWRTRSDPFEKDWPVIAGMLKDAPELEAKTLMNWLCERHGDRYRLGQLRTLQRRVRDWRALEGPEAGEVMFPQTIMPGKQGQADFTVMDDLAICIDGQPFPHLLFHFMLPYSRWEAVSICFSETFEALARGYELAVWGLGGVPPEQRTDNLSAATQRAGGSRAFTTRWGDFLAHFGVKPSRNNPGKSNENGSVEKSHDLLKNAVNQALLLRGNRNFTDRAAYEAFLGELVARRNGERQARLADEMPLLKPLPARAWNDPAELTVRVCPWSTIVVLKGVYSVPSRLIGHQLRVLIYADEVQVFYGKKLVQQMPRLPKGRGVAVNYRHVVGHLVRKPGAFANYSFREELFPGLAFRRAYDRLRATEGERADKAYLEVLHLAAMGSEAEVTLALEMLIAEGHAPTAAAVRELTRPRPEGPPVVTIPAPDPALYDGLLMEKVA